MAHNISQYRASRVRRGILSTVAAGLAVLSFQLPHASALNEDLRESQSKQQQIQTQTQKVSDQIDQVIAEFQSNGIANNDDVKTLKAIRAVLGKLSDDQMQQVVALLQQASTTSDPTVTKTKVTDAYNGQKDIIAQLRVLLVQYQQREAAFELSMKFQKLADRQNANLKLTVDLAKATIGRPVAQFDSTQADSLHSQRAEQGSLREGISQVIDDLKSLADADKGDARLAAAIARANETKPSDTAAMAVEDLSAGNLLRGASDAKKTRDQLRELAEMVAPPMDKLEQLRDAQQKLAEEIAQQKEVVDDSRNMDRKDPVATERKQADVVDENDTTRKELTEAAPIAADKLKDAQEAMQNTRQALNDRQRDPAVQKAQDALANLEAAKAEVDKQVDQEAAKDQETPPQDPLAAAKELAERADELKKEQHDLADKVASTTQPSNPQELAQKEQDLEQKTKDLEADAAKTMPEPAKDLDDATKQQDAAQDNLNKDQKPPAAPQAQQAAADIDKAAQKMNDQVAKMEQQEQKDLAAMEAARDKVAAAMEKQAEALAKTQAGENPQQVANQPQQQANDKAAEAAAALPQPQQAPQQQQQQDQQQQAPDPGAALQQAQQNMATAKNDLNKNDANSAEPQQKDALANLEKAKDALDQQIAQAQQDLGKQPDQQQQDQAMNNVENDLKAAQQDVAQAKQELGNQPDAQQAENNPQVQDAKQHLEKAAEEITKANTEDQGQLADAAKEAMKEAAKQVEQGTKNAEKGQEEKAEGNADKAEQALAQADAAAKAGQEMAKGNEPGQDPGQEPGQEPGQMPGMKPGQYSKAKDSHTSKTNMNGNPNGERDNVQGKGSYAGLPPRDRQALQQSQAEKYPAQYGAMVEQYYRNLSDEGK
jgi:hypothetical protein